MLDFDLHAVEYLNLGRQRDEEKGDYAVFDFLLVQVEDKDDATGTALTSASGLVTAPADASSSAEPESDSESIGAGAVAGAVVGAVVGAATLSLLVWFILRRRKGISRRHARAEIAEDSSLTSPAVSLARSRRSGSEPLTSRSIGPTSDAMGVVRPFAQPAAATPMAAASSSLGTPSSMPAGAHSTSAPLVQTSRFGPGAGDADLPQSPQEAPPVYTQESAAQSKGQFPSSTVTLSSRFR